MAYFSVQIRYNNEEGATFHAIAEGTEYDRLFDRFQSLLVYFKIPHTLHYESGVFMPYEVSGNGISLKLCKVSKLTHLTK